MPVKIIYHGHSTLEIHSGPHRLQLDPFYNNNPLADIKADAVNPTHILLSHAHGDHTEDVIPIATRTGAQVICNFEMSNYYQAKGIKNISGLNYGGGADFPFGRATYTLALHTSTFPDGANGGLPGGWIIETGGKTIYFAGDTALFGDMQLLGQLYPIDLACLPIGDRFTMGPAHALRAAQFLKAKRILPIHYNTWPPIAQDPQKFAADLARLHIDCSPLSAGQSIEL